MSAKKKDPELIGPGHGPQSCANCRFMDRPVRLCRKYAPRPDDLYAEATWPRVKLADWCGEWEDEDAPLVARYVFVGESQIPAAESRGTVVEGP